MANAVLPSSSAAAASSTSSSSSSSSCFELPENPYQLKCEVWAKIAESTEGAFREMVLLRWESSLESVPSLSSALAAVACHVV